MVQDLRGKTAIVTGGGSGINLEFCRLLLNKGVNVLIADKALRPEARALLDAFSDGPTRALYQETDVTQWPELSRTFEVALDKLGPVDIVCPGAGVYEPPFSSFWRPPGTSPSLDDPAGGRYALLDINLTHPIRMTQLAVSHFLSTSKSTSSSDLKHIIHVSSIAGQLHPLAAPMYNASKHAINGFVRSLGPLEAALGIRVNAVAPGIVKTPMWLEDREKGSGIGSTQEWVTPEEVAEVMMAFLEGNEVVRVSKPSAKPLSARGGTIIEVSNGPIRTVEAFNDPGPMASLGKGLENSEKLEQDVWKWLKTDDWGKIQS